LIGLACAVLVGELLILQIGCGSSPHRPTEPPVPVAKLLAVLEFKGASIKDDVLDTLSDAVRGGAVAGLAGRGVKVMTRESMMMLLRDMGKQDCTEGDCEVETARNIGADFVVSGSVVQIEDTFVVSLKLHETGSGTLLAADQIQAKNQIDLLPHLSEHGRILSAKTVEPPPAAGLLAKTVEPRPAQTPVAPARSDKSDEPHADGMVMAFEYASLGGSNSVARRNVYAAAVHSFMASFGSGIPLGLDLDAVLGRGTGFYYDLDLLLGPGWWFNQTFALAALGGVGIDGITSGVMPFALKTPVRLALSLNLGATVRVETRAGFNWLYKTSNRRKAGSEAVGAFADEMVAGGMILIGERCAANRWKENACGSFALGFTYTETLGTRSLLFMVGAGLAMDPHFK